MVNFVGFFVIHVSQGSVATYVRYGGICYMVLCSNFPAESASEIFFKLVRNYDLTKLLPKV